MDPLIVTAAFEAANPFSGNSLKSRCDLADAANAVFKPLLRYFSQGGARVRLSDVSAIFDRAAADLEGFARPLWGLVPLVVGGYEFDHWPLYRKGLVNGMNPAHPEYWGDVSDRNQRLVELAAIGLAMRMVPQHVFHPLADDEKAIIGNYLVAARNRDYVDNNWKFFRVLVDLGLEECGIAFDRAGTRQYLDDLESFAESDGWYRDGPHRRMDHYIPFAMHFYGLIYAALCREDNERAERLKARARRFALDIRHWYGPDGAALAFGRSQTYRFAAAGFWAALAFADVEALPWGEVKGYYLRHMRWWADKPFAERDGVLSIGFAYPNLLMSESYNSAGSPYWAMKAFLALAVPAEHPFWQADEQSVPEYSEPVALSEPGMVAMHTAGNVVVLSSGQEHETMRGAAEKYAKFVYSTRYGFSIEANDRHFDGAAFDGMIGFSKDGKHFRMRETLDEALIAGTILYSRWRPFEDVTVETWLLPQSPWHIRVHRIVASAPVITIEGGFAVRRADFNVDRTERRAGFVLAETATDVSAIADIGGSERTGRAHSPLPNTNLINAKTIVPQLLCDLPSGTSVLATAAMALPLSDAALASAVKLPAMPDLNELESHVQRNGVQPGVFRLKPVPPVAGKPD